MPIYVYRCPDGHENDHYCRCADRPQEIDCSCGLSAKRIYTPPFIAVDNFEGYDIGLGRSFSNGSERKAYIKEKGYFEVGPEDSAKEARHRKDLVEKKQDTGEWM